MSAQPEQRVSPADYLRLERAAASRSEYLEGEVFAMTGASRPHNLIAGNVFAALHRQVRGRDCEVYTHDMRVLAPDTGLYTYPDVVVACGEPRFEDAELDTLLNPTLIVEVLSPSTADHDRGGKFVHYRSIPSFAEYLLVAQDRVQVEHFARRDDGRWLLAETGRLEDSLTLGSIDCALDLSEIYESVPGIALPS